MIHQNPVDQEIAFTNEWWSRTVNDFPRLITWLKKLQQTEIGGYNDYMQFIAKFTPDDRTTKIFTNIAQDEQKHSGLIIELLDAYKEKPSADRMPSSYWTSMNENIIDLETAAAVNYFGEALAAFRFDVILAHPQTSSDIKNLFNVILPDEVFHRETLMRLAGNDLLEEMAEKHHRAVAELKGTK